MSHPKNKQAEKSHFHSQIDFKLILYHVNTKKDLLQPPAYFLAQPTILNTITAQT